MSNLSKIKSVNPLSPFNMTIIFCKFLLFMTIPACIIAFIESYELSTYLLIAIAVLFVIEIILFKIFPKKTIWDDVEYGSVCLFCKSEVPSDAKVCRGCQAEKSSNSSSYMNNKIKYVYYFINLIFIVSLGSFLYSQYNPNFQNMIMSYINNESLRQTINSLITPDTLRNIAIITFFSTSFLKSAFRYTVYTATWKRKQLR